MKKQLLTWFGSVVVFSGVIGLSIGTDRTTPNEPLPLTDDRFPMIDVWVSLCRPFDPTSPTVAITYECIRSGTVYNATFDLPTNEFEMGRFEGVTIKVDGDDGKPVVKPNFTDWVMSKPVRMKPGDRVELVVPLQQMVVLPTNWHTITVCPKMSYVRFSTRRACNYLEIHRDWTGEEPESVLTRRAQKDQPKNRGTTCVTNSAEKEQSRDR